MGTRCQIGFYSSDEAPISKPDALVYRGHDGYPGRPDGGLAGVLTDTLSWLADYRNDRGIIFTEEWATRFILEMNKSFLERQDRFDWYISSAFHTDIDFFYQVTPNRVIVWQAGFDIPIKKWRPVGEYQFNRESKKGYFTVFEEVKLF